MVTSSQLTGSEYQPAGRLDDAGGSPSHMDIPIHRATLLSGELHARLDPVAFPQNGSKYVGTVAGVTFPAVGIPLATDTVDANPAVLATPAGAVKPSWTGVPVRSDDTMSILDGWGVSVAGHKAYKLVLELANGVLPVTQFDFDTFNAPQVGMSTSLVGNVHSAINAIYVIHAEDAVLPANALLIQRFADAYVPPPSVHFTVNPVRAVDTFGVQDGWQVLFPTPVHYVIGVTYVTPDTAVHHFAGASGDTTAANQPVDGQGFGEIASGTSGVVTELWIGPDSNRANATLVWTF